MPRAPILFTRREAAAIGGVSLSAIDKAIEQGVIQPTRRSGQPLLLIHELALLVLLREIDATLPHKLKLQLRDWLARSRPRAVGSELALSEALRVAMTKDVAHTIERAKRYGRLRNEYVEFNPAVMGGEPVIAGTRVPVRTVASLLDMGETPKTLQEDYPQVPQEAYEVAQVWTRAHPRRGRPVRPWDDPALQSVANRGAARVA